MAGEGSRVLFGEVDFSLVLGGPLFQLLRRVHLSDDALTQVRQRILALSPLTWLPLLVLSALGGQALGGTATVPFLLDVEVHVRFLVAMPLLIAAELVVHQRMRTVARKFLDRRLIPDARDAAVRRGDRLGVPPAQLGARRGAADRRSSTAWAS